MFSNRMNFALFIIVLLAGVLFFYLGSASIDSMAVRDMTCTDGTKLYTCSEEDIGNECTLARSGPRLEFSEKCYE